MKFSDDSLIYNFLASVESGDLPRAASMIEGAVLTCNIQGFSHNLSKSEYSAIDFVTQISDCEIQALDRYGSAPSLFNVRWECDIEMIDGVAWLNGGYNARITNNGTLNVSFFSKDGSVDEHRFTKSTDGL